MIQETPHTIKRGTLVRLYNLYRAFYYEEAALSGATMYSGSVVGMYIETGRSAQFEFYKIAVLKDEDGKGGFVQNYLTSDFSIIPLSKKEEIEYGSR